VHAVHAVVVGWYTSPHTQPCAANGARWLSKRAAGPRFTHTRHTHTHTRATHATHTPDDTHTHTHRDAHSRARRTSSRYAAPEYPWQCRLAGQHRRCARHAAPAPRRPLHAHHHHRSTWLPAACVCATVLVCVLCHGHCSTANCQNVVTRKRAISCFCQEVSRLLETKGRVR